MGPTIRHLVDLLGSEEPAETRRAGRNLLKLGAEAAPALRQALHSDSLPARKAAAYLLGQLDSDHRNITALKASLRDPSPKVRKNAAISLGAIGDRSAVASLADALQAESVPWVRASMILSLGKLGGDQARDSLSPIEASSPQEAEALRKAQDRVFARPTRISWAERAAEVLAGRLFLRVPNGLGDIAVAEAVATGLATAHEIEPGLVYLKEVVSPRLLKRLRCVQDVRILLGQVATGSSDPSFLAQQLSRILSKTDLLTNWVNWLETDTPELRYRFALDFRVPKTVFTDSLRTVRETLMVRRLTDSPSNYAVILLVERRNDLCRAWLIPTFERDERFAYRRSDVGASIDPVTGACLARLVRTSSEGTVFDPTCGSATLLIERAQLDDSTKLVGIDVSPTSVRAAKTNVEAAGLASRIQIRRGDARIETSWPTCSEILANLPFGQRTGLWERDLQELYRSIVTNLDRRLRTNGRAVLYTINKRSLESEVVRSARDFRLSEIRQVQNGKQIVHVFILDK